VIRDLENPECVLCNIDGGNDACYQMMFRWKNRREKEMRLARKCPMRKPPPAVPCRAMPYRLTMQVGIYKDSLLHMKMK